MKKEFISRVLGHNQFRELMHHDVNIMMGQTFDSGSPFDMLKYAHVMNDIAQVFPHASSRWLLADHFVYKINGDHSQEEVGALIKKRSHMLRTLNEVYGFTHEIVLSSELSQGDEYQNALETLLTTADSDSTFRERALRAVPEDRRNNPGSLVYPFEELATIQAMDTHIKVGPRYEIHYDAPARDIADAIGFNKFVAVHLSNSYPLGNPTLSKKRAEVIEEYGVLCYKLHSKDLGKYRIDLFESTPDDVARLFSSTKRDAARLDFIAIVNAASQRRGNGPVTADNVIEAYEHSVYNPIQRCVNGSS